MYPRRELARIALHKARRLKQIELRRIQCVETVARGARPLIWIHKAKTLKGMIMPLLPYLPLAVALGILAPREAFPRLRATVALARLGVLALAALRGPGKAGHVAALETKDGFHPSVRGRLPRL